MICGPDGGKTPRKEVEKAVFQSLPCGLYRRNSFISIELSLQLRSMRVKEEIDVNLNSILTCAENLARQISAKPGKRLWIGVREAGPPIHVQEARR